VTKPLFGEAAVQIYGAASLLLGWRVDEFWNSTPFELSRALQRTDPQPDAPDRATIDDLRRRFPDDAS
jgi:hypothetical protein